MVTRTLIVASISAFLAVLAAASYESAPNSIWTGLSARLTGRTGWDTTARKVWRSGQ